MSKMWQSAAEPANAAVASPWQRYRLVLAVAIIAGIFLFWAGFGSLLEAWSKPEYSHGYFILPLALYLVLLGWRNKPVAGAEPERLRWLGPALVAIGAALGLLGNLSSIPDIITYGLLISIAGVFLAVFGLKRSFLAWPAWAYLWFMLPLPNAIYWPLSIRLQFLSSEIGVAMVKLLGIPVFLDGNIIDLGIYQLQVAEACSGLRYLFPLMSFGFLFAILYEGKTLSKTIIFLSSIPITILMNSIRIAVVAVLVSYFGNAQAEGFLHFFEGWVVFIACLVLLYAVAYTVRYFTKGADRSRPIIDMPATGLIPETHPTTLHSTGGSLAASAAILTVFAMLSFAFSQRTPEAIERRELANFPLTLGDMQGKRQFLDQNILLVLGADDYLMADYAGGASEPPINLLVSYYLSQTNGSGIHSPEVCIPAGGWEVSNWSQVNINLPNQDGKGFQVNRAIIQKGLQRQLVYYWFEQRGRRVANDYAAKLLTVWDAVVRRRSDGALVRLATPINTDAESAERRLQGFAGILLKELGSYVPP